MEYTYYLLIIFLDMGYVQGMSYIVSILLLYLDENKAFQSFINLLSSKSLLGRSNFHLLEKSNIDVYIHSFDYFFQRYLPLLYFHFKKQDVCSEMFLLDWHLSLFAKSLSLEVVTRVWDLFLVEGEVFLTKTALGILRMYAINLW
jgi:hypothetical protein